MGVVYLNIFRPVQQFFLAPGQYALKSLLLASYNGDIFSAKRLLPPQLPSAFVQLLYGNDRGHVTKRIARASARTHRSCSAWAPGGKCMASRYKHGVP